MEKVVGTITENGEIVYVRGEYYVTRKHSTVYADMLRVYVGSYWRMLFATGDADNKALDRCVEWVSKRRCFKAGGKN